MVDFYVWAYLFIVLPGGICQLGLEFCDVVLERKRIYTVCSSGGKGE